MNPRFILLNLAVMIVYDLVLWSVGQEGLFIALPFVHAGALLVFGLVMYFKPRPNNALSYLLGACLVGLIGFGTCTLMVFNNF
ncbi:MAG TPA: hypothetical protein VHL57_06915 [Flavobacteriales bacterium]|jgi:hypothetical protein|nr:hypothetical protein [Flavobacteriales bacterium]